MEQQKQIATAFIKAQSEMNNAVKSSNNPFFKSKYADINSVLEAIIKPLNSNGICVLQPIVIDNGIALIKTILLHSSGEQIDSLTPIISKDNTDAQKFGSAVTYARRYALQSICSIGAEDDDGNLASKVKNTTQENKPILMLGSDNFNNCKKSLSNGYTLEQIKAKYSLSVQVQQELLKP